jgi:hypothetical protein
MNKNVIERDAVKDYKEETKITLDQDNNALIAADIIKDPTNFNEVLI